MNRRSSASIRSQKPGSAGIPAGIPAGVEASAHKEWYSRGYLPHRDEAHLIQSITFRLADSFPAEMLDQWRVDYVEANPVTAKLAGSREKWPWSSVRKRLEEMNDE